jgi:hypothetical protein
MWGWISCEDTVFRGLEEKFMQKNQNIACDIKINPYLCIANDINN